MPGVRDLSRAESRCSRAPRATRDPEAARGPTRHAARQAEAKRRGRRRPVDRAAAYGVAVPLGLGLGAGFAAALEGLGPRTSSAASSKYTRPLAGALYTSHAQT